MILLPRVMTESTSSELPGYRGHQLPVDFLGALSWCESLPSKRFFDVSCARHVYSTLSLLFLKPLNIRLYRDLFKPYSLGHDHGLKVFSGRLCILGLSDC